MNNNQLIQNNIENLTNLFKVMGAKQEEISNNKKLHLSDSWPNRLWMPYDYNKDDLQEAINTDSKKEKSYILSLWERDKELFQESIKELESKEYKVLFKQIGMYLDLNATNVEENNDLEIKIANTKEEIKLWTKIASESFGYEIDVNIIEKIAEDENTYLLLAYKNGVAVATTLLFENSSVMGVHLVGVPKEHRAQGIAENIMKRAITLSKEKKINIMVLQASLLGLGIYQRLGFKQNFMLRNYQK